MKNLDSFLIAINYRGEALPPNYTPEELTRKLANYLFCGDFKRVAKIQKWETAKAIARMGVQKTKAN